MAVVVAATRVVTCERVPLYVETHALRPAQRQLDGPARVAGEQGGMPLDAQVFLRAERSAAGDQGRQHFVLRQAQQAGNLPAVAPDALALRVEMHAAAVRRIGQGRFRLKEGVLDELGLEGLRKDVLGPLESGIDVTALDF